MADADIKLLFGVLGGGSISEGSGLAIKKDLDEIIKQINSSPLKVKVALDTEVGGQKSWSSQLQTRLNAISESGKFSAQISKLKIGTGAVSDFKNQLSSIISTLNLDKGTTITLTAEGIGEVKSQIKQAGEAAADAAQKVAAFKVQMEALTTQKNSVKRLLSSFSDRASTDEERARIADLNTQYEQWAIKIETVRASKAMASNEAQKELMAEGAAIRDTISELLESAKAAEARAAAEQAAAQKGESAEKVRMATLNEVISAYRKINDYLNKNPRIVGTSQHTQLVSMRDELAGVIEKSKELSASSDEAGKNMSTMSRVDLRAILNSLSQMDIALTESGKKGKTLAGLIESAYKKFGGWMLVTRSLMVAVNGIKQMVANVTALDSAMTELRKVTDETDATYKRFLTDASARAKALGATLADTVNATADFARLGYSLNESANLADAALVYKNVGDGIANISDASESIISTMKAFGIEASKAMSIVDRFNEVGNNFAISSSGVGEALLRSASALATANNSLDESIALVTAANNVIQNPEKVGTALKTVSMYLRAAKTEAEEAGESTDGMADSVAKLRDELLMLTGGRVDIQIDEDTFKSTYQIMKDLSEVWDDLTDINRANILEQIGGKRNSNVVTSLLKNFETAEEVLKTTANSAGSALAENEKYLDSIAGKIAKFQSTFETLSSTVVDSGLIKGIIDAGTGIVETLNAIIEKLGAVPPLISAITGALTLYKSNENNSFGFLGVVDNKIRFDPSGIRGTLNEFNKLLSQSEDIQGEFITKIGKSNSSLASYLKTVKGGSATLAGYKDYCKQAGTETKTLGTSSKIASVGVTVLNTALNMMLSMGIALLIQGIVAAIGHLVNAADEAIERTKELNDAFQEFKATNSSNIQTLESLKAEFETLSKGVSRYGENISLSADEYDRYKAIVETIVGISPALSEGYSIENGYLADKNELIERAIELQEQQYQNELRQMTTTAKLKQGIEGYVASYGKLQNGAVPTSGTDLSNALWQMFRVNDRSVVPDFGGNAGDSKSIYLSEQILKALGVTDIGAEIKKYTNENGYYQWGNFWDDYADKVSRNIGKIASSINYSEAGFDSLSDFELAVAKTENAATEYLGARDKLEQANQDVANQLKLVAERNSAYSELSNEAKNIVSHFVDQFSVEDVSKTNWFGMLVPDEEAIETVRIKINKFIESLTPEIQNAVSGLFDLKESFDLGDIDVSQFQSTVNAILADLKAAGFDDETIRYLSLSLETDMLDRQLDAVREAIGGLEGQYDDVLGKLSSQELSYAYKIVAEGGSMTIDELMDKLEWLKYQGADMVNVLDFSQMIDGLTDAKDGIDSIISAMDRLNEGTAMTKEQLANLALQYPKLLEQSDLFVDGSIDGQKQLLNNILEIHEAAYDAQLDEKIAELKATEQVINDQLEMETDKANIIADIKNMSVNGIIGQEEELVNKMNELNDLQGQNYVAMENGELVVNQAALNEKLGNENEYGQQAAENIWEPYANTITSAHTQGFSRSLEATNSYGTSLFGKIKNIVSSVWSSLGEAVKDATTGNWQGLSHYFQSAVSGMAGDTTIDAGSVTVTFDGQQAFVGTESLDSWVSNQEKASIQRIAALEDLKTRTVNAYKNLEALRGLDLTGIYGSAGSGFTSNSGSSGSSSGSSKGDKDKGDGKSEAEDTIKDVEEYIADIDAYYEAQKKLEELQAKRSSLEKKLKHSTDPADKIKIASQLVDSYREEANAERELMDLKRQTIMANVGALRGLGFQVEYNSDANKLYIKNLEHLNDLTATSAGKYDTLQEATNALRKETETLIDVTERLNEDNIAAAGNIEDLTYEVLEAKNNIIDYIEEIYDTQVEAYQKIIALRKELIESAKEEYDYESDVADKVKEIAELQARIDQLALDDSRSAQAERNSLMQQLAEKQKDLADTQRDHTTDAQVDALDKMAEDYETQKADEIETLRGTVGASEELWNAFYKTMLGQNVTLGDSIDTEIANAWLRAAEAVNEYSASVKGVPIGSMIVDSIPKYHDGGIVREANLSKDEALAVLQKGEVVLNEGKQQGLYKIIDFQTELAKRMGAAIGALPVISALPDAKALLAEVPYNEGAGSQGMIFEPHIDVEINHNGDLKEEDARDFGGEIADAAIGKLYNAFERRGISSTRGSRLKP